MKKAFVCGFLFDPSNKYVILIEKQKPDWQKGFLNGVGGAVEANESPLRAMIREFNEETGLSGIDWKQFCRLIDGGWYIDFFKAQSSFYDKVKTTTIEKVVIIEISKLFEVKCIPNLRWLIPMCLDPNHHDGILHTKRSTI